MNYDDEEYDPYAGFGGGGCSVHGEDYMRECSVCGMEFCVACFPNSSVCEECAAQGEVLDDEEDAFGDSDAEELKIVAELAPDDPELDKETEAALNSFGDPDDETDSAPSDDVLAAAEKSQEAVAREAAKAAAKAKAKAKPAPVSKPKAGAKPKVTAKPKSKPTAKASAKKPSSKARK